MTTKKTTSKSSRIPEFKSREEEAEFWDTHSTADYEDEFKRVRVRVSKKLSEGLTIRLDQDTLKNVRTLAHEKGIGPTTLIRMWVVERMKKAPHHPQGL